MFPMNSSNAFNTDYWNSTYPGLYTSSTTDQAPMQGHPALPAFWWLGFIIVLIVIRLAYELMD